MTTSTLKTKAGRTFTLIITEEPERILLDLAMTKHGALGDDAEFLDWLAPILLAYDEDPRPLVMRNPHSGETATVADGFAIIEGPTLQ